MESRRKVVQARGGRLFRVAHEQSVDVVGVLAADILSRRRQVVSEYDALQRRRKVLLAAVAEQHALFVVARHAEENYAERQEYLGSLSHGADEMCAGPRGDADPPGW